METYPAAVKGQGRAGAACGKDREMEREEQITGVTPETAGTESVPEQTAVPETVGEALPADAQAETAEPTETAEETMTAAETAAETPAETFGETPAEGSPEAETPEKARPGFLRASRKWTDIFPIAAVLSVGLMMLGELLTSLLHEHVPVTAWFNSLTGDEAVTVFLSQYFDFIGIWVAFIVLITIFWTNWPMWKAFSFNRHGNNLRAILAGILLGGGMNGFCILMSVLQGDIKLSFNRFDPALFFLFLLCVMIQSGAEEIIDRCYLYQKLRRRYRWPIIAILVNSLVFSALHMFNPNVTWIGLLQVFEIGVLFSLIIYFYDSLWTVIWAHTAWNFSQSIVFGLPNSGIVSAYSVFRLDAASARNGIFYNVGFGVEGSIGANAVIGVFIVLLLLVALIKRKGERADHWAGMEEKAARPVTIGARIGSVIGWILMAACIAGAVLVAIHFYNRG